MKQQMSEETVFEQIRETSKEVKQAIDVLIENGISVKKYEMLIKRRLYEVMLDHLTKEKEEAHRKLSAQQDILFQK